MAVTKEDVMEFISNMSVLELSEMVKEFEEKFGVSAQATVVAAAGAGDIAAAADEQTEFNVVLTATGDKKINVIKVVREVTGLGLKEAKDATENTPSVIKEGASKEEAEEIKKKFEEAGATCELK
ncbi:MAG: 50S ribosomal protein L7/L12 [Campylobacterales bacterium]|nr:50S ribosomal protein L7/L12 [Campylobacterales bacterium]